MRLPAAHVIAAAGRRESGVLHIREAAASRLLLVHSDASRRGVWRRAAELAGFSAFEATSLLHARAAFAKHGPCGVVVVAASRDDARLGSAFVEGVGEMRRSAGQAEVLVVTECSLSMETCCELVQVGVSGFVDARGGVATEELAHRMRAARDTFKQVRTDVDAALHAEPECRDGDLVWSSPAMRDLLSRAARAAQISDVPVLIFGESGTGKQLLADYIHRLDPKRNTKRLLSVNCSAISGPLAESMLFGHVKGAYTGATGARQGIFRAAHGGTVLLDEIGEMELSLQPKLLRALQEGLVMPLGSDQEVETDVRVVAATNRRLAALVEEGRFRLDLYQRLNVIALEIPPLRDRPEDIPALVRFFLKKYASYCRQPIESVDDEVYDFLRRCTLEGNVRELENAVRHSLAFKTQGSRLTLSDIPPQVLAQAKNPAPTKQTAVLRELEQAACRLIDSGAMTLPQLVSMCEELVLRNSLANSRNTNADLARQLGLSRRTLYNKINKYRLADVDQA